MSPAPSFQKCDFQCHTYLALCTCCVCFAKIVMTMNQQFSPLMCVHHQGTPP